jgi:aldehyde:ferredoxin oxidoreductase
MGGTRSGFAGQMLRANLSTQEVSKEPLDWKVARDFLGGKGYSANLLFRELEPGLDPLGPDNKMIFMTGPLTGTRAPTGNRFCVSTKSPLTGTWLDAHCGGSWGPELKWAGYDGIIIEGRSEKPVYLHVHDDEAALRDAAWIWGADTFTAERFLKSKHEREGVTKAVVIGPAGERQALLAGILSEVRAAGRGGAGAVMGSKKLKGIVVKGTARKPEDLVAKPREFKLAIHEAYTKIGEDFRTSRKKRGGLVIRGTSNIIDGINEAGGWPTRNFQTGSFDDLLEVDGDAFAEKMYVPRESAGSRPCWNCPIRCAHVSVAEKGPWSGTVTEGPEYETVWAFGPQCGVSDREAIARADYLCDYYGMDTISVGNTIGFLMECREKGLIAPGDTDGIELGFGNVGAMIEAVERAGTLRGKLGKLVGNGVKRASAAIGKGSESFAMHTKGLEFPAYMPRAAQGMGLSYARSDRGACHLRPWTAGKEMLGWDAMDPRKTEGKAAEVKSGTQNIAVTWDSSGLCLLSSFAYGDDTVLKMVAAATGFEFKDKEDFLLIGERIDNLTRAFNAREGFTRKDDTLPERCLKEPHRTGPCKGLVVRLDEMLEEYYRLCGWDKQGVPTEDKLRDLGLSFAADQVRQAEG